VPIPTNTRAACAEAMEKAEAEEPWFGIEQEYTLLNALTKWPLGWPDNGYPAPQVGWVWRMGVFLGFGGCFLGLGGTPARSPLFNQRILPLASAAAAPSPWPSRVCSTPPATGRRPLRSILPPPTLQPL
jgi:hypothetical protein